MIQLHSQKEIDAVRSSGRITGAVLNGLKDLVKPGVTTQELDRWAEKFIRDHGGEPAFKGYHGFPSTLCTSPNEQVVHGIPGSRRLREGDIISIDVGVRLNGWYSDAARTYPVGKVDEKAVRLMDVTEESLQRGIAQARGGNHLSDIGHAVQEYVEAAGFSVVRDYVGHGIGRMMHEEPQVPNFGQPKQGLKLKVGMLLAIEPMVNAGGFAVRVLDDQWTVVTLDGSRSAHFEHTIAIAEGGAEILTL